MGAEEPRQKRTGRPAWSYRGARKKAEREAGAIKRRRAPETIDGSYDGSIELNRSERWSRAKDYGYAREVSPSTEPVR